MTQYLLAIRSDGRTFSPEEFRQCCIDVPALHDKMTDAGVFVFHGGLLTGSGTVVRQSGDDFMITDGPYTETKEHLAGFWIINAASLAAALEWAKLAAAAERQTIEVVPFEMRDIDELLAANEAGEL